MALPAAYRRLQPGHPVREALWAALSFSAYFWAAAGIMLWKAAGLH